jgi:hypothetical protein
MTTWIKTSLITVALWSVIVPARAGDYATNAETFVAEYDKGVEVKIYAQGLVDGLGAYRAAAGPSHLLPANGPRNNLGSSGRPHAETHGQTA